jgi:CAAX prenyl protease-like protein
MSLKSWPPWVPYAAPFALFLLLTTLESQLPLKFFPIAYALKIALVGGLLIAWRGEFPEARPGGSGWAIATALGIVLCLIWVWIDPHTPHAKFLGARIGYNPSREISTITGVWFFLAVRFLGLVVVVPFMEELFYRGFLLRFVTDTDNFQRISTGTFSAVALLMNVGLFALSHPEWLAAAIFALAMCLLLKFTKNLFACVLAHGVTNLLLGVYILHTAQWQYW